jgi:hypothetical protein
MRRIHTVLIISIFSAILQAVPNYQEGLYALSENSAGNLTPESDTAGIGSKSVSAENAAFDGVNLPLMVINTNGTIIERSPRVMVDMGLIYNGVGKLNKISDPWNEYSGKIGINRRGESSYNFEKRQYRIELQNFDGSNNNVSILGLPRENDFILNGPYSDKTMMKNVLTYELFRRTGRWAPRTRYIEVVMDNEYRGVYVLTEKLKQDKHRVNIHKLTSDDNTWPKISGGYILRRDKTARSDPEEWWESPVSQPYHKQMWYEYYDPNYEDLTTEQAAYIKNWMKEFDEMMSGNDFMDPVKGYRSWIDVESFIDMLFINEITKGIDNYNFSNYFYKENDMEGGRLVAGPPWDYNIGYGNVNYGHDWFASETYGWCYTQGGRIYWYKRLMEDPEFRDNVYCRWTKFRNSIYRDENVLGIIDSCVNVMGDAVERNFNKYDILGKYVWPAKEPIPATFMEEVWNLEDWLIEHLYWMDDQWYGKCQNPTDIEAYTSEMFVKVYPNPSDFSNIRIELNTGNSLSGVSVELTDINGKQIERFVVPHTVNGQYNMQLPDHSHLPPGLYLIKVISREQPIVVRKLIKTR